MNEFILVVILMYTLLYMDEAKVLFLITLNDTQAYIHSYE